MWGVDNACVYRLFRKPMPVTMATQLTVHSCQPEVLAIRADVMQRCEKPRSAVNEFVTRGNLK
jgi:hypothetical protein